MMGSTTLMSMNLKYIREGELIFTLTVRMQFFPPGVYLFVLKVMDFNQQPYVDNFSILRVRKKNEVKLIKEFRDELLNKTLAEGDKKFDLDYQNKRNRFMGRPTNIPCKPECKSGNYTYRDWDNTGIDGSSYEGEIAKEWLNYRVQHIRYKEAKAVKNLK